MLILLTWSDPVDDIEMKTVVDTLGAWAEEETRKRDLFDDFIYLNYVNGQQPIYERAVTPIDLERMQNIPTGVRPAGTLPKILERGLQVARDAQRAPSQERRIIAESKTPKIAQWETESAQRPEENGTHRWCHEK